MDDEFLSDVVRQEWDLTCLKAIPDVKMSPQLGVVYART